MKWRLPDGFFVCRQCLLSAGSVACGKARLPINMSTIAQSPLLALQQGGREAGRLHCRNCSREAGRLYHRCCSGEAWRQEVAAGRQGNRGNAGCVVRQVLQVLHVASCCRCCSMAAGERETALQVLQQGGKEAGSCSREAGREGDCRWRRAASVAGTAGGTR